MLRVLLPTCGQTFRKYGPLPGELFTGVSPKASSGIEQLLEVARVHTTSRSDASGLFVGRTRLALDGNFVGAHLWVSPQQVTTAALCVRLSELLAVDPGIEIVPALPARDHQHLVRSFRAQNLHREEAWKPLYVPPAVREPLDDLIGHPLLHRQTIEDSDHI